MQEPPEQPPQYAAYPRGSQALYGTGAQLRALYKGYSGLTNIFVLNIVLSVGLQAAYMADRSDESILIWLAGSGVIGLAVAFGTYPYNKSIASGANWNPSMAVLASALIGLNSALCCGIIGYVVMQQLAMNEMKRYGVRLRFVGGIRKRDVEEIAAQLEAQERGLEMYPPPQA